MKEVGAKYLFNYKRNTIQYTFNKKKSGDYNGQIAKLVKWVNNRIRLEYGTIKLAY